MTDREREIRMAFAGHILSRIGYPYGWGGTGPRLYDCSGIGTEGGWDLGLWPRSVRWVSSTIHRRWEPISGSGTDEPQIGDAVTYRAVPFGPITHVMFICNDRRILIDEDTGVGHVVWPVAGASGGNRFVRTAEQARKKGAAVKRYGRHDYRRFVAGFRRLPIPRELLEDA